MKERNISLNLQIKIKNFIEYSHQEEMNGY